MGSIKTSHNKQVLQHRNEIIDATKGKKERCRLDNKCLTPNIIFKAQITSNTNDEHKKM